jgi:hypothetical protein
VQASTCEIANGIPKLDDVESQGQAEIIQFSALRHTEANGSTVDFSS